MLVLEVCWEPCGLWWWSRFLSSFAKKKRVLGYAGTVIRLPQSPHQQTVKGFSLSLGLFNLLQCLRSLCILLTLLDISARLPCRQSHLSWTRWGTRNWKVDREAWRGMDCVKHPSVRERLHPVGPLSEQRTERLRCDEGVMTCDEWPVTVSWHVTPGCHLNVTDRSTPAIVWLSTGPQSPDTWERQPSTVSWAGRGWEWLQCDYIPSQLRQQPGG